MSTFYAYYTGPGGCDYTIACNRTLGKLKATTKSEAEKEIEENFRENLDEYGINKIQLLEVHEVTNINVAVIKKSIADEFRLKEIKRVEAEERAQYDKLKNKFDPRAHH